MKFKDVIFSCILVLALSSCDSAVSSSQLVDEVTISSESIFENNEAYVVTTVESQDNTDFDDVESIETTVTIEVTENENATYDFWLDDNDIPYIEPYSSVPYICVNDNIPFFYLPCTDMESFEYYGDMDELGRCTCVYACIGRELMPTEDRGPIGMVKPSGWQLSKYDFVDGKYLFNRCHLIGFQLTGENANENNLITGTRYLNIQGMLPFENNVAEYIKETDNHVMYRVTPKFDDDNLLCDGVLIEAMSVEDSGASLQFNVFCYNVQPNVGINYTDDSNWLIDDIAAVSVEEITETTSTDQSQVADTYILNTRSKKIHYSWCSSVDDMAEHNKQEYDGNIDEIIAQGYEPCKRCNP